MPRLIARIQEPVRDDERDPEAVDEHPGELGVEQDRGDVETLHASAQEVGSGRRAPPVLAVESPPAPGGSA